MSVAISIDVNTPQMVGAPTISVAELREKIQAFVNSLAINVVVNKSEMLDSSTHRHSLSGLRGICKSGISDEQAMDEILSEKF